MTFRTLPIRRKLTLVMVLTSTLVLLLATASFFAYELVTFREAMVRKLATEAELLGMNSASALAFADRDAATKTLGALHAEPHVLAAAAYGKDGTPFAVYVRDETDMPPALTTPPPHDGKWHRFADGMLVVSMPIVLAGEPVGSVRIVSDLGERNDRLRSYLGIVGAVFVLAILASIALAAQLQRVFTDRILRLVDRARTFGRRPGQPPLATPFVDDEVTLLVRTFEDMLARIQAHDETLERARDEAEGANRAKDEFLAVVSHELRTPLTPIIAWARLLQSGKLDAATTARAIDVIDRNARAQAQLVNDLLDVSRIVAGKVRLEVKPVDVRPLVEAAVDAARPAADAKGIRVRMIIDPRAGVVSGDGQRLQQVFWNLLSNAIKFTPRGGRVQVTLSHVDSQVELTVTDTGQGIKPEFLPHVFERFRQADNTTTRVHGGLGLGLAIVRHIVELHGGGVRVASEGDGRGATFTVTLPVAAVQPAAGERPQLPPLTRMPYAPSAELSGIRVLVVDDDQDTLEMLELVLRQAGADVRTADSAGAGFRTFREWHPHVVVSDIGMPGEDGYAFINKVRGLPREDGGQTPAIALTAYARSEDRIRVLSAGFQMHVAKPIEPAELVASLASIRGWTGTTH